MAEEEKVALSERTHPLYDDNINKWELYEDAVEGGDKFITQDYLFSHRLEDGEDYDERLERAYYLNYCEAIPNIYNYYIMKENIERPVVLDLEMFRENADRSGKSIGEVVAEAGFWSKVYGVCHILVDSPNVSPKTKQEEKDMKFTPYCTVLPPTKIKDWSTDGNGNYNWILIESTYYRDSDPTVEREEEVHYKLITRDSWRIEDEDGELVQFEDGRRAEGTNELGIVPIISLYHDNSKNSKIGKSLLKDIVYINRSILNWCSCIDEQIERQTFSQLVIPDDGTLAEESESGDPLHRVGTSSIWTFPSDAGHPPNYISPNTENIRVIWSLVIDHIKEIFRLANLIGSSDDMYVSRSGRAAQMGFLGVNSALSATSKKYEKAENEITKLALKILGKDDTSSYDRVKYPTSFDIASLSEEIDAFFKLMSKNFSKRLNKTVAKDLSRRATPLAPNSVRQEIEDEIEAWDAVVVSSEPESKQISEEDGNPNSNLGKSFRTKEKLESEERTHRKEEK